MKDQIKYHKLSEKDYINDVMFVGGVVYGSDEYYSKILSQMKSRGSTVTNQSTQIAELFGVAHKI